MTQIIGLEGEGNETNATHTKKNTNDLRIQRVKLNIVQLFHSSFVELNPTSHTLCECNKGRRASALWIRENNGRSSKNKNVVTMDYGNECLERKKIFLHSDTFFYG